MYFISYQTPSSPRFFRSPLSRVGALHRELFGNNPFTADLLSPKVDLFQDGDTFVVKAELPGLKREDFQLTINDEVLTLSGERRREETEGKKSALRSERVFGKFHRQVTLPTAFNAEKVMASYEDGVLTVTLPKAEEAKPRQIKVK